MDWSGDLSDMGKTDITVVEISRFWKWINDRHMIYLNKEVEKLPFPWIDDPIFQEYKFTNAFRELDRGTLALRNLLRYTNSAEDLAFNIIWYRSFNRYEHAKDIGVCWGPFRMDQLSYKLKRKDTRGHKIFTSAHMTVGKAGVRKIDYALECIAKIDEGIRFIVDVCRLQKSLSSVFDIIKEYNFYGPFIAYEIVTDFRWYPQLLADADDIMTWANIGPGCARGLRRLGLPVQLSSLEYLLAKAHHDKSVLGAHVPIDKIEMREIEHSLCEFDKYERVRTGVGQPRERYRVR